MILKLVHNFSGQDYTFNIDEVQTDGHYFIFTIPFPEDAPKGEYGYKMYANDQPEKIVSSGIINYSQYLRTEYCVKDNVLFTIYDQN